MNTAENFRSGQDTERAGAARAAVKADSIRAWIFDRLKQAPSTDEELEVAWEEAFGRTYGSNTIRRRRVELKTAGLVAPSGEKRRSRYGVDTIVWTVAA